MRRQMKYMRGAGLDGDWAALNKVYHRPPPDWRMLALDFPAFGYKVNVTIDRILNQTPVTSIKPWNSI